MIGLNGAATVVQAQDAESPSAAPAQPAAADAAKTRPAVEPRPRLSAGLDEIVKLAKAGVDESVILAFIQSSSVAYRPSAPEIIKLRELGISSAITTALLRRGDEVRQRAAEAEQESNKPRRPARRSRCGSGLPLHPPRHRLRLSNRPPLLTSQRQLSACLIRFLPSLQLRLGGQTLSSLLLCRLLLPSLLLCRLLLPRYYSGYPRASSTPAIRASGLGCVLGAITAVNTTLPMNLAL